MRPEQRGGSMHTLRVNLALFGVILLGLCAVVAVAAAPPVPGVSGGPAPNASSKSIRPDVLYPCPDCGAGGGGGGGSQCQCLTDCDNAVPVCEASCGGGIDCRDTCRLAHDDCAANCITDDPSCD